MDDRYFDEYCRLEREHWWFRARHNILAAQVSRLVSGRCEGPRILNVGAAYGASSEMLRRFGDVISLEYDVKCCEVVEQRFGWTFINASVTELPFPGGVFDLVCAYDVIEHVEDDARAVQEMMRVCKPGGAIAVTVPAFMQLWSHHDVVNHHERRYRLPELKRLFSSSGRIIFGSYFNALLFPPILAVRILSRLMPEGWMRQGAGSDFSLGRSHAMDPILYRIFNAECPWLEHGGRLPFGVSAMLNWRKDEMRVPG